MLNEPNVDGQFPYDPVLNQKSRGELADFSKWQLENVELVESVYYVLCGYHREVDKDGGECWVLNPGGDHTLSEAGAREVQSNLYPVTQKNVLLANMSEDKINLFTKQVVGNIIIRLGAEAERFGLVGSDGLVDTSKFWKVKDVCEATVYAAFTRSNDYMTLKELNRGHQVHELIKQREQHRGFSLFRPQVKDEGDGYG